MFFYKAIIFYKTKIYKAKIYKAIISYKEFVFCKGLVCHT